MLRSMFHSQLAFGFAQAVIAAVLALAVVLLARRRNIHLESDAAVALLRGIVIYRRRWLHPYPVAERAHAGPVCFCWRP